MIALHCDWHQCNSWQRAPFDRFLVLASADGGQNHFCCTDCVMLWAAQFEPVTSVEM